LSDELLQGEAEHCRVKNFYARTNKVTAVQQISVLEQRERIFWRMVSAAPRAARTQKSQVGSDGRGRRTTSHPSEHDEDESPFVGTLQDHHVIPASRNSPVDIILWLQSPRYDDYLIRVRVSFF
jgi:hypothetical protein